MNTLVGPLPRHLYVYVDTFFTHDDNHPTRTRFIPAVWFGLVSYPGRVWGCTVLLECGAVYRSLPVHALAFTKRPDAVWTPEQAQCWDCYGVNWSALEYPYLSGLACRVRAGDSEHEGEYLFTVAPVGDAFSAYPEQAKEFKFIRLTNGRLTVQPTNRVLFEEKSFTTSVEWPKGLRRQTGVYQCE